MTGETKGGIKGLDAPGFGERTTEDLKEAANAVADESGRATGEDAVVDAEFGGMDNDLVDLGTFGESGTGKGTQTGGAGERLRPVPGEPPGNEASGKD